MNYSGDDIMLIWSVFKCLEMENNEDWFQPSVYEIALSKIEASNQN